MAKRPGITESIKERNIDCMRKRPGINRIFDRGCRHNSQSPEDLATLIGLGMSRHGPRSHARFVLGGVNLLDGGFSWIAHLRRVGDGVGGGSIHHVPFCMTQ